MNVGVSCQKIGSGRCSVVRMPSEIREEEGPKERVESMASNRTKVQQQSLSEREERQVTDDGRRKKTRSEEEGKCWAEADKMRKESLATTFANDEMPQFRPESSGFSSTFLRISFEPRESAIISYSELRYSAFESLLPWYSPSRHNPPDHGAIL